MGNRPFAEKVKARLGLRAKRKEAAESNEGYQLSESGALYKALFGAEKDDIGIENTYLWDGKTV